MAKDIIGFIGLGVMGRPMAENLRSAGYPLVVHNRSQGAVEALVSAGAERAGSPAEVAARANVVITMLPDTPDVEAVYLGPQGVLAAIREGSALLDMSTASPSLARRLAALAAEKGASWLDAPVSGGEVGARAGTLSIMVGGDEAALERARPLLEVMGSTILHIGGPGTGQVAKAANQIAVGLALAAVGEALTLAKKGGADPARVRGALLAGFAQSRVLDLHGERALKGQYDPGFRLRLHRKDLGIALALARESDVPLAHTALLHETMNAMIAAGDGDRDHAAVIRWVARLAGMEGLDKE